MQCIPYLRLFHSSQLTRHCERSEAIVSLKSGKVIPKRVKAPLQKGGCGRERPSGNRFFNRLDPGTLALNSRYV